MLVLALLAAAVAGGDLRAAESPPGRASRGSLVAEGAGLFHTKGCDQCHAASASGEKPVGPELVGGRSWRDVMQFSGSLWNHIPRMLDTMRERGIDRPAMSRDDMEKLVEYIFYASFLDAPGDAQRGRTLFEQRSCARCHQVGGRGGTNGPRLDELGPYATSIFMAQALWNHGPGMAAKVKELGLEWPRLEDEDLSNLLAFIRGKDTPPASIERIAAECGNPRSGKTLFEARGCRGCHAVDGDGDKTGPDLGSHHRWRSFAEMAGGLWNHAPAMWAKMRERGLPYISVSESEMADIMAYLYYVQFTAAEGDVTRGDRLFVEKTCAGCHAAGKGGQDVGPDLAGSEATRSSVDWASAMWNHAPKMEATLRESGIAWPRFEDDEMRDLVAFLRSRRGAK